MAQKNTSKPATIANSPFDKPNANANANAAADTDTPMPDANSSPPHPHKRNRKTTKQNPKEKESHILFQSTFRNPQWTYLHLTLTSPSFPSTSTSTSTPHEDLSPLLVSPLLTSALRAYLGTMGAAISLDILKTAGRSVWIRVPRQDVRGVRAALGSWVGSVEGEDVGLGRGRISVAWRVVGCGGVLGLGMEDGSEVFG